MGSLTSCFIRTPHLRNECLRPLIVVVFFIRVVERVRRRRRGCRQVLQHGGCGRDGLVVLMSDLVEEFGDDGHCKKQGRYTDRVATQSFYIIWAAWKMSTWKTGLKLSNSIWIISFPVLIQMERPVDGAELKKWRDNVTGHHAPVPTHIKGKMLMSAFPCWRNHYQRIYFTG